MKSVIIMRPSYFEAITVTNGKVWQIADRILCTERERASGVLEI